MDPDPNGDAFWLLIQAFRLYLDDAVAADLSTKSELGISRANSAPGRLQNGERENGEHQPREHTGEAPGKIEPPKSERPVSEDSNPVSLSPATPHLLPPPPELIEMEKGSWSVRRWLKQRTEQCDELEVVDQIMALVGLEKVKEQVLRMRTGIRMAVSQGRDLSKDLFSTVLMGNAGTGKTTFAHLYAKFLVKMKVVSGDGFKEMTPIEVIHISDIKGTATELSNFASEGGGVFFIDNAHTLVEYSAYVELILGEIERYRGKIIFVLAGYRKEMEKLLGSSPSASTRVPNRITFCDYSEEEMRGILYRLIRTRFPKKELQVEGGFDGVNIRILTRRLCRGRGSGDTGTFSNARLLEGALSKVLERQAYRLDKARGEGEEPDSYLLTQEDLIGPPPEDTLRASAAWKELQNLVGLDSVKEGIISLADQVRLNYDLELEGRQPMSLNLNQLFLGPPGTGKTTVSKLYARILHDMGLVSRGEVLVRNPADFVGKYIGHTEANTKGILQSAMGNILVIDEAHMLFTGKKGGGLPSTDQFRAALIDTLVAGISGESGEDRAVILVGYPEAVEEMLQHCNPGLSRRFPIEHAFRFYNFDMGQLVQILESKSKADGFAMSDVAREVAVHKLRLASDRPHFGNGGEVDNMLNRAKIALQRRLLRFDRPLNATAGRTFEPQDFDPDYKRLTHVQNGCRELFKGFVGCEEMIAEFEGYQQLAAGMRMDNVDPRPFIPFTFVFKGPPGTGKTTTARKMGQIFYDMGFLSAPSVVECSVSDLIGIYQGQTGPKVVAKIEQALGKVLFIDEAYRLAARTNGDSYAREAASELVDCITKPQFANKLVIILAGYSEDMDNLMSANQGLASRFPHEIDFHSMTPDNCLRLLEIRLAGRNVVIQGGVPSDRRSEILRSFTSLASTPSWGNARDVETLAKTMIGHAFQSKYLTGRGAGPSSGSYGISYDDTLSFLTRMLEKKRRHQDPARALPAAPTGRANYQPLLATGIAEHIDGLMAHAVNSLDRPPARMDMKRVKRSVDHGRHEI